MVTKLNNFGIKIHLDILRPNGELVERLSDLRIDFHIKQIAGLSQAKLSVFNLSNKTIASLNSRGVYIRLSTQLHDRQPQAFSTTWYVNNTLTYKALPNAITELYCVAKIYRKLTEKQIQAQVRAPTLQKIVDAMNDDARSDVIFKPQDFPEEVINHRQLNPKYIMDSSAMNNLEALGEQFGFSWHEDGDNTIILQYHPTADNLSQSGQLSRKAYVLNSTHMRGNPKVGVARMTIESNLDFLIKPGTILDAANLVTAQSADNFKALTLVNNWLKTSVTNSSRFFVLTVEHKGSNYSDQWATSATAVKTTRGKVSSTYGWY